MRSGASRCAATSGDPDGSDEHHGGFGRGAPIHLCDPHRGGSLAPVGLPQRFCRSAMWTVTLRGARMPSIFREHVQHGERPNRSIPRPGARAVTKCDHCLYAQEVPGWAQTSSAVAVGALAATASCEISGGRRRDASWKHSPRPATRISTRPRRKIQGRKPFGWAAQAGRDSRAQSAEDGAAQAWLQNRACGTPCISEAVAATSKERACNETSGGGVD